MTSLISDPIERGILIVDDDKAILEIMKDVFSDKGYKKVYTADDGMKALSILTSNPKEIYLILLDLRMPNMDGISLVKHLANVHSFHVGIIIVTAFGSSDYAAEFFKLGTDKVMAMDFLSKPIDFETIFREVEGTLEIVHNKRMGHIEMSAKEIHNRFDRIDDKLKAIDCLPEIKENIFTIAKKNRSFAAEIGMDLIRSLVIALALLAFLYLGVGNFLRHFIERLK